MDLPHLDRDWSGARVTVMGLGLFGGGAAVARAFVRRGARVTVTDRRTADVLAPSLVELEALGGALELVLGTHRHEDFTQTDLVVANPAVRLDAEPLQAARAAGVPIASEAALFLASCPARVLAVTGTQGKSSVCNALFQLLETCGRPAHLGGNIGRPLVDRVEGIAADDVVVLELSSYQLEALPPPAAWAERLPRVAVACVTNVLSDHLERHGSRAAYRAAKHRLLELVAPGGALLVPADDPELAVPEWRPTGVRRVVVHAAGEGADSGGLALAGEGEEGVFLLDGEVLGRIADLPLPGEFQRTNALFALGAARLAGLTAGELARALPALRGLPHRLEDLGLVRGHRVWDNGVSTTPDSTAGVVGSLRPGFTLLCGGQGKDLPLEELARAVAARAGRVVAFGAARDTLARAFLGAGLAADLAETLEDAVERAFSTLDPDAELLFSPACASFDAYPNFQARALAFRAALERISTTRS